MEAKDLECLQSICRAAAKMHNFVLVENDGTTSFGKQSLAAEDFGVNQLQNSVAHFSFHPCCDPSASGMGGFCATAVITAQFQWP